ncbi:MAG: hypothetical protein ACM3NP_06660 [Actinomycetota bacterium]
MSFKLPGCADGAAVLSALTERVCREGEKGPRNNRELAERSSLQERTEMMKDILIDRKDGDHAAAGMKSREDE